MSSSIPGLRLERDNQPVALAQPLGEDGDGITYALAGQAGMAAHIFSATARADGRAEKLASMIAHPPVDPGRPYQTSIAWPTDRLLDAGGQCAGYLLPQVAPTSGIPLHRLFRARDRAVVAPSFTWKYLLHTAGSLAAATSALHAAGYVIGDFTDRQVQASLAALVTLLDCDAMQVRRPDGSVLRCVSGTPEFTPPELQGADFTQTERAPYHDNFALGVLGFMLLMEGTHPFSCEWHGAGASPTVPERIQHGQWPYAADDSLVTAPAGGLPFQILPPAIQTLMTRCFVEGYHNPLARPTGPEWHAALIEAESHLRTCGVNPQHQYGEHLAACPWCDRMRQELPDAFPPLAQVAAIPPAGINPEAPRPAAAYAPPPPPPAWTPPPPPPPTYTPPPAPFTPSGAWAQTPTQPQYGPAYTSDTPVRGAGGDFSRRVLIGGGLAIVAALGVGGVAWLGKTLLSHAPASPGAAHGSNASGASGSSSSSSSGSGQNAPPIGTTLQTFTHGNNVVSLAWSPDGKRIVTACEDGTAQVWDVTSGSRVLVYRGHAGAVWTVSWSPDGRYIASGSADRTVHVWDASTGNLVVAYQGHTASLETVAWSPNSQRVASASDDTTVQVWDATTGANALIYRGHTDWAYTLDWSPQGDRIASGGKDSTVQVWDATSGTRILTYQGHTNWVDIVAWSPQGDLVASGSDDNTIRIWHPDSGDTVYTYQGLGQMIGASWSPNAQDIASSDYTTSGVRIWTPTNGNLLFTYNGHGKPVRFVAYSPNGQLIASGSEDHSARVWQAV